MLASQELLIKSLYKAGVPFNTLVHKKSMLEAELVLTEEFSISLFLGRNPHGLQIHSFYIGDQQVLSVSNSIEFDVAKKTIIDTLINAGCTEEYAQEVIQSFHCVLYESLMSLQSQQFLAKLLAED